MKIKKEPSPIKIVEKPSEVIETADLTNINISTGEKKETNKNKGEYPATDHTCPSPVKSKSGSKTRSSRKRNEFNNLNDFGKYDIIMSSSSSLER